MITEFSKSRNIIITDYYLLIVNTNTNENCCFYRQNLLKLADK